MTQLNKLNIFNDGVENRLDEIIKLLKKIIFKLDNIEDKHDDKHHKCGCGQKHEDKCKDCCIVTLVLDQAGAPNSDVIVRSFNTSCPVNCTIVEGTTTAADAIACLCERGFNIVEAAQVNPNRPVLILRRCRS